MVKIGLHKCLFMFRSDVCGASLQT